jgi:hypothetical protein
MFKESLLEMRRLEAEKLKGLSDSPADSGLLQCPTRA